VTEVSQLVPNDANDDENEEDEELSLAPPEVLPPPPTTSAPEKSINIINTIINCFHKSMLLFRVLSRIERRIWHFCDEEFSRSL